MAEVFSFSWDVPVGGFRWVTTRAAPREVGGTGEAGVFLVAVVPPFQGRRYAPLHEHPALFRLFAETPPTEAGILGFANQYGGLGPEVAVRVLLAETADATTPHPWGWGEPLSRWQEEIFAMRRVVSLWDQVQAGDTQGLAQHIHWREGDETGAAGVVYTNLPAVPAQVAARLPAEQRAVLAAFGIREATARERLPEDTAFLFAWIVPPGEPPPFRPGDLGQPALWYIQTQVNAHLAGPGAPVTPRLLWDPEMTALGLYCVPPSLRAALWLQCAQAIAGNKSYRQCRACAKWFEVSVEASRPTRLYCSDACRFKAYRRRQDEAYDLAQRGLPLKEIAKRLGTDVHTAKGWIKKRKEE